MGSVQTMKSQTEITSVIFKIDATLRDWEAEQKNRGWNNDGSSVKEGSHTVKKERDDGSPVTVNHHAER